MFALSGAHKLRISFAISSAIALGLQKNVCPARPASQTPFQ